MRPTRRVFNQLINADGDFSLMGPGEWINASCMRIFSSDKGKSNRIEGIGGTLCLFSELPVGVNYCMGGVSDPAKKRLIFANYNSNGNHGWYCFDKASGATYPVLLNAQVENGLGFNTSNRLQCAYLDGQIVYTENKSEIKSIDVERGIKLNNPGYITTSTPYPAIVKATSQTIIKRPPIQQITWVKGTDANYKNNFTANSAFFFTYRYKSRKNQYSALASYSQLATANFKDDTYNKIDLTIPLSETIDDDTFSVELCVKYGDRGITAVVKTWDRNSDGAAIDAHNAGTQALTYTFYNDVRGNTLDSVEAARSFDLIPQICKTLVIARNRTFLANYTAGYDTPTTTSLTTAVGTFDTGSAGSHNGKWKYMRLYYYRNDDPNKTPVSMDVNYLYCADLLPAAYYYTAYETGASLPASVNAKDALTAWDTEMDLAYYLIRNNVGLDPGETWLYNPAPQFFDWNTPGELIVAADVTSNLQFFKSNSTYKISIAFYDQYKRKCGVVKQYSTSVIPMRTFNQSVFSAIINWTLDNAKATDEIPDWAYYYKIHITKNQTASTFFQINTINNSYVKKGSDGTLTYTQGPWADNTYYATAFDLTQLFSVGMGYNFTDGDILILYKGDGTNASLPVLGADGINILVKPTDIGNLTGNIQNLVEVYTPYKPSTEEFFYEAGDIYPVSNPGTPQRTYSTLDGQINGDCYAIERDKGSSTLYFTETMSPNDKFWQNWEVDRGWPNAVDPIGKQTLSDSIMFSDPYVTGSNINGMNVFQPANSNPIGLENGDINKLALASKTQEDGSVMLALCNNEVISIYLGETELYDTRGSSNIVRTNSVIGYMKALKGGIGCQHPESVFEYSGLVFFWSIEKRCAVQYSNNGLFPISNNKFKTPASLFSKDYAAMSLADFTALGSYPYIIGGYDPYHDEPLFSIPSTKAVPPKGFLVDYPQIPYPYDIYDGQGKILIYKSKYDGWLGSIPVQTEMFLTLENDLYSFKNGCLYIHNQDNIANFYGQQYTSKLMFQCNPGGINEFRSIGIEGNKVPKFTHFRTEDPFVQSSELLPSDWEQNEGVIEAPIYKDRLSPSLNGSYLEKQFSDESEYLSGKSLLTMLEFDYADDPKNLELRFVNFNHVLKEGTIINESNG